MFFLAKAYQRLGEHTTALELLQAAMKIELNNDVIAREASLECIHLNNISLAVQFSGEAIRRNPDNVMGLGNHAMNLLIAANDEEASAVIAKAIAIDPSDKINLRIQNVIQQVKNKQRNRPTCGNALTASF